MGSEEWRQKVGKLVGSEYDRRSKKWQYRIYFDYDNDLMKNLKKSSLFGVESHESANQKKARAVLRTVYTEIFDNRLNMRKNFPGVIQDPNDEVKRAQGVFRELMGNPHDVEKDPVAHAKWEEEIGSSGQTKISILAEQTGLALDGEGKVRKNYQRPRVGADVEILDKDGLDSIYNKSGDVVSIGLGKLHGVDLEIKLDVRKMVTQHSGLFGSTGAGKSNMVSNIIRKLVGGSANVVVFDIEEEYSALLADCFDDDHRFIAFVDEDSIPYDMKQHMKGVVVNAEEAAKEYVEQMSDKMPDELAKHKENFVPVFKKMIEEKRIRFLAPREMVKISDFITQVLGDFHEIPGLEESKSGMCMRMQKWKDKESVDRVNGFNVNTLSNFRSHYEKKYNDLLGINEHVAQGMQMFERDIDLVDDWIKKLEFQESVESNGFLLDRKLFIDLCQNKNSNSLVVLQSENEEVMLEMVGELITDKANGIFRIRKTGKTTDSPLTLFVFDEADRFIPQSVDKRHDEVSRIKDAQIIAKSAVGTLVRKGRKIKLGAMIATQRTTYMDTSVMGQIHTYYVSWLPRREDRQRVSEGFGLSDEDSAVTNEFSAGDWMILSKNATGLRNRPIIVEAYDANEVVKEHVTSHKKKDDDAGVGSSDAYTLWNGDEVKVTEDELERRKKANTYLNPVKKPVKKSRDLPPSTTISSELSKKMVEIQQRVMARTFQGAYNNLGASEDTLGHLIYRLREEAIKSLPANKGFTASVLKRDHTKNLMVSEVGIHVFMDRYIGEKGWTEARLEEVPFGKLIEWYNINASLKGSDEKSSLYLRVLVYEFKKWKDWVKSGRKRPYPKSSVPEIRGAIQSD